MKFGILFLLIASINCIAAPVEPPKAAKLNVYEIGDLVKLYMPIKDGNKSNRPNSWEFNAQNPNFIWSSNKIEQQKDDDGRALFVRDGLIRIHIQGKYPYEVRKKNTELAWKIKLLSKNSPQKGVEEVWFYNDCFGSQAKNCEMMPMNALKASGIQAKKVCETKNFGDKLTGYRLTHNGREDVYFSTLYSEGSGGSSTSYTMKFSPKDLCKM